MKVKNMVCPQCSQTHGRAHLPGCPRLVRGQDYARGWMAAREAYGRLGVEAADRERAKIIGALREVTDLLERGR